MEAPCRHVSRIPLDTAEALQLQPKGNLTSSIDVPRRHEMNGRSVKSRPRA
jgi:hypothetical protein